MNQENHSDRTTLMTEAQRVIQDIGQFDVSTFEQYHERAAALKQVKAAIAKLEAQRTEKIEPFRKGIAGINAMFKEPIERLEKFETEMKGSMLAFIREQDAARREAQRKADEQARKERESAMAKAAEEERKSRQKAEDLRNQAEQAKQSGNFDEARKLDCKAERAEESGMVRAQDLRTKASTTVAPTVQIEKPVVAGISTKQVPKFRIIDANRINATFLKPDEEKIRKQVNALKLEARTIIGDGVEIWMEESIAASRKG